MEFKDLVALYFERSNAMQTYWNFYLTIVLGLMAFFGTVKITPRIRWVASLLILAFLAFVYVNLGGLREVDQQRIDAKQLIQNRAFKSDVDPGTVDRLVQHMNPPEKAEVTDVHIAGDVLTIGAILALVWKRKEQTEAATKPPASTLDAVPRADVGS